MKNPLSTELKNPKNFYAKLPKKFSEIKKNEIVRLYEAFECGMYTEEKNKSAAVRLDTLLQEAVANRMKVGAIYN